MTGRATFGGFLQAAHHHLDTAPGAGGPVPADGGVEEVSGSLLRVVTVMGRYLQDITASLEGMSRTTPGLTTWARASIEARDALASSARFLHRGAPARRWPTRVAASPLARRLDKAAVSLTTGRDLLQTHFAPGHRGGREPRSDWALVITSPPVTRALLAEIGSLSRRIARQGADLALAGPAGRRDSVDARRALNAACQWLWVLDTSVRAAHQHEPARAADGELLYAIPANAPPPRRLPEGGEPVPVLCDGTISTAERLRHLAWGSAGRASWSPGMSVTSLHQVAAASTATSHNCEVLLRTLAARPGPRELRAGLLAAADAAGRARDAWWHTARAAGQITTDTRGQVSLAAAETRDLALWTGRLAYADPQWTPASGPTRPARPPGSLAAAPGQMPAVISAVHHVSETLTRLAQTEQEQIRAAAQSGRILVTTRSLPDEFDIPRPFARAPHDRIEQLLSHYQDAGHASRRATQALAGPAETTRAPSRILTTAHAATAPDRGSESDREPDRTGAYSSTREEVRGPGPVERTLLGLGVTRPELLRRGADIDQASEQLIISAAADHAHEGRRPSAPELSRSAGTAALINHALASGDPRAAALVRPPAPARREAPEREP